MINGEQIASFYPIPGRYKAAPVKCYTVCINGHEISIWSREKFSEAELKKSRWVTRAKCMLQLEGVIGENEPIVLTFPKKLHVNGGRP